MKSRERSFELSSGHVTMALLGVLALSAGLWMAFYVVILSPEFTHIHTRISQLAAGSSSTVPTVPIETVTVSSKSVVTEIPTDLLKKPPITAQLVRKPKDAQAIIDIHDDQRQLIAMTNDGWFITAASALDIPAIANYAVNVQGTVYPIKTALRDTVTGFAYLHAPGARVSAGEFLRPDRIDSGATVYLEKDTGVFIPTTLVDVSAHHGLLTSSVASRRMSMVLPSSASIAGHAVRDSAGRVVGIVERYEEQEGIWLIIPVPTVTNDAVSLVQSGVIKRAQFTPIKGYDVTTIARTTTSTVLTGLLVTQPVQRLVLAGDIIERVERDALTGERDLGEILLDYKPGAAITLYGKRNTESFQANVVLESVTSTVPFK